MRVMIHGNAPWAATGYGVQTRLLCRALQADGHEVAVSANYGLSGTAIEWEGIRVYPNLREVHGNDVLTAHAAHWFGGNPRDGLVITLYDAWVFNPAVLRGLHVAMWAPVDHDPIPPKVAARLATEGVLPVAMSRFGETAMKAAGLEPMYAPHAYDPKATFPEDQTDSRDVLGLPRDAFVVGMVAANKGNPSRKGFSEAFQAFAALHKEHPGSLLYLHTEAVGQFDGIHLPALLEACEIPADAVRFSDQYAAVIIGQGDAHMRRVYSAMDVLMNPAHGEGFGVPVLEAQACGTPVIVQDFTAMTEVGQVGWQVGGQRVWSVQNSWQRIANVEQLTWALSEAYKMAAGQRDAAVGFARAYEIDRVYAEYWRPILDVMRARIDTPPPAGPALAVVPDEVAA